MQRPCGGMSSLSVDSEEDEAGWAVHGEGYSERLAWSRAGGQARRATAGCH